MGVGPGAQLAAGSCSAVFEWGRDAVVKVPFMTTPDAWIHYEARYTAAVRDAGAPAPRLHDIVTIAGRAASVYERARGPVMWDRMLDRPAPIPHRTGVLAELRAHVFSLVAPLSLPGQRDRLTCKIRPASQRVDPSLAAAMALLPPVAPSRLCHGDLHPGDAASGRHLCQIGFWAPYLPGVVGNGTQFEDGPGHTRAEPEFVLPFLAD